MNHAFALLALTMLGCGGRTEEATVPSRKAGAFVAVGADGALLVSDDAGARWDAIGSGTTKHLAAVAAGAGRIVAVGADGTIVASTDARAWSVIDVGAKCDLNDVAFIGDRFLAVGGDWSNGSCAYGSRDGATWTSVGAAPTGEMAQAVALINGSIIVSAYGRSDLMWPALFRIVDDRWEAIALGDADRSVVFRASTNVGGVTFVVAGGVSEVTSVAPWALRASPEIGFVTWDVAASDTALVAVGENGVALRTDGAWTRVLTTPGVLWTAIARGPSRFVAVGQRGRITTSTDGRAWSDAIVSSGADLRAVTYLPAR